MQAAFTRYMRVAAAYAYIRAQCDTLAMDPGHKKIAIIIAVVAVAAVAITAIILFAGSDKANKDLIGNYAEYEVITDGYSGTVKVEIIDANSQKIKAREFVEIYQGGVLFYSGDVSYWEPIPDGNPPGVFYGNQTINNATYGSQYTYIFKQTVAGETATYYIGADGVTYRMILPIDGINITMDLCGTNLR
jgi:hypothetical protein